MYRNKLVLPREFVAEFLHDLVSLSIVIHLNKHYKFYTACVVGGKVLLRTLRCTANTNYRNFEINILWRTAFSY
jgi:hypothetical protein